LVYFGLANFRKYRGAAMIPQKETDQPPSPGTPKRILGILTVAGLALAGLGAYGYYVGWPIAIVLLASPVILPIVGGAMVDRRITPLRALQYLWMIPLFVIMQLLLWAMALLTYVGPLYLPVLVIGDYWFSYLLGVVLVILTVKYLGQKINDLFESVTDRLTSFLPDID
jgi:hypothetical protein